MPLLGALHSIIESWGIVSTRINKILEADY